MNERTEQRKRPPLIHGRMIYRCELCGNSWPMYLEKGVEEFGANHKPSPFTITCPYCGGLAMDVSGIQKVPGGGYVPLPDGYGYFANVEGRDCGVPTFPPPPTVAEKAAAVGKTIEVIIADEIDGLLREQEMELALEAIAGYSETETREIMKKSPCNGGVADLFTGRNHRRDYERGCQGRKPGKGKRRVFAVQNRLGQIGRASCRERV